MRDSATSSTSLPPSHHTQSTQSNRTHVPHSKPRHRLAHAATQREVDDMCPLPAPWRRAAAEEAPGPLPRLVRMVVGAVAAGTGTGPATARGRRAFGSAGCCGGQRRPG